MEEGITKSQAKPIEQLIQIHKGLIKRKQKFAEFKEPVLFLIRRNQNIEFYENATKGEFAFEHTDGDIRKIDLVPSKMMSFPFADRKIRCYICQEDSPLPLPEDPVVSSELIRISQEKSMHDINEYRLKEAKVMSGARMKVFIGIAIVIGAIALAIIMIPESFWNKVLQKETLSPQQGGNMLGLIWGIAITRIKNGKLQRTKEK